MNTYTCTSFTGHFPVGTAAVVVARSRIEAAHALEKALATQGLPQTIDPKTMLIVDPHHQNVRVLLDGNY